MPEDSEKAQRRSERLSFVVLIALLYCAVVGLLLYVTAWFTGRSFLETLSNLWVPALIFLGVTVFSTLKITNEERAAATRPGVGGVQSPRR